MASDDWALLTVGRKGKVGWPGDSRRREIKTRCVGQVSLANRRMETVRLSGREALAGVRWEIKTHGIGQVRQKVGRKSLGLLDQEALAGIRREIKTHGRMGKPLRAQNGRVNLCGREALAGVRWEINTHSIGRLNLANRRMEKERLSGREALAASNGRSILTASDG
ncbi:hypothetical protein G5714_007748 [Onychostoma macrolepis]|uniref:Uncharacterized protein n=1 Tax=Onychostoma macrolepis TaxID=369639 RepID=A0A7J6CTN1_9TELE|nr:hypothetical protein G5714_007748 [Onychostoma macrolepis]